MDEDKNIDLSAGSAEKKIDIDPVAPPVNPSAGAAGTSTNANVDGKGYSNEELRDPNNIVVTVSDPSPVVVLFGAGSSGKTMTLVRLTRYLRSKGYTLEPDRAFRPSRDEHYKQMCDQFHSLVNDSYAPDRTRVLNFMLVKVMDSYGNPRCQILEAPGEHFFNAEDPNTPFPTYINNITQLPNRKIWIFIVERNWKDQKDRANYAKKIEDLQSIISTRDHIIFACHKADLFSAAINNGIHNEKRLFHEIKNQYPGIFSRYKNKNPITSLFNSYNFEFVVFSAGTFNPTTDKRQVYTQGKDFYPERLWKAISKGISGNIF